MDMAPGQAQLVEKVDHSCCPGGAPKQEDPRGPNCCAFVPTAATSGIAMSDSDTVVAMAVVSVRIVKTQESGTVSSTRAPPIYASPHLAAPSSRAPPTV